MCGIDVVVRYTGDFKAAPCSLRLDVPFGSSPSVTSSRRHSVIRRGPDSEGDFDRDFSHFQLNMFGCVLQIQGDKLFPQPGKISGSDSRLLWNGEYLNHPSSREGDTKLVLERLESFDNVVEALDDIEGPFAFVFYDSRTNRVWFGKDKRGRRSLLFGMDSENKEIVISSCALEGGQEIPAGRNIFCLDMTLMTLEEHEWKKPIPYTSPRFLSLDSTRHSDPQCLYTIMRSCMTKHMCSTSVTAPLGILFSGGVDSAIIASLAAEIFVSTEHNLSHIDLINVASADSVSPDRATGLVTFAELLDRFPASIFRFIVVDIDKSDIAEHEAEILRLASPNNSHMDFNISSALWFGSRARGRILDPSFIKDPSWDILRDQIVSCESVESAHEDRKPKRDIDRSVPEMCTVCGRRKTKPGCQFSACKICCIKVDTNKVCPAHTAYVDPSSLVDKISVNEFIHLFLSESSVESSCRIIFVGHGADELFGGYGRHATRSSSAGPEGLRSELLLDLSRLWTRNLGRDDRIIADHARDTRHPFLDDQVVEYVGSLKIDAMISEEGANKPLLRKMAREVLGLKFAPNFRKRAIQFGTRLAQQTNVAVFGSHSKGSGKDMYRIS